MANNAKQSPVTKPMGMEDLPNTTIESPPDVVTIPRERYEAMLDAEIRLSTLETVVGAYLDWCERSINAGPVGNPRTHAAYNKQMRAIIDAARRGEAAK